jgi:homoserine dehydrogenase
MLGCGVVGTGVARILREEGALIAARTGRQLDIAHVIVRDANKNRAHSDLPFHSDPEKAIDDPKTKIVVELMGGTDAAAKYVERALRLGKPVVTANKSLLASRGPQLFKLAREHKTCIAFEASCAGGIPIIDALTRGLVANRIDALVGIVNGTCNFILTQMTRHGWAYRDALAEAQKLGFAEADPTMDVSGRDAAQKLAILASLAFNALVSEADIDVEGIDKLQDAEIKYAGELGYVVKLLAMARRRGEKISLRVHPTLVKRDDVLADVNGSFNAISVYGHALGHALFYGRGAGQMPTASAVVADLVHVALGITQLSFSQLRIFPDQVAAARVLPPAEEKGRFYLRLAARDEPGVLAQVTRVLGEKGISLSAILQHESGSAQAVPVVITTHMAREGSVRAALEEIDKLGAIHPPTVCLRILDQPAEFSGG